MTAAASEQPQSHLEKLADRWEKDAETVAENDDALGLSELGEVVRGP